MSSRGLSLWLIFKFHYLSEKLLRRKNLEQSSIRRRNVLKALHTVYKTINNQEEKDKIITVGAAAVLSQGLDDTIALLT